MTTRLIELPDLRRILLEGAGAVQGVDLGDEILDSNFEDLGYDSIAIMETAARISREYGIAIDDESLLSARTPRLLLDLVNPN
ncbi:MAG: acyl carrier protein [Jatrophihabitantaceae bacterium]